MSYLVDLVLDSLTLVVGIAPERPLWLRRLVQAFWILLGAVLLVAWVFGLVALIRAL